jgi:hypothetical protein
MFAQRIAIAFLLLLVSAASSVSAKVSERDLTILKIGPSGLYYEEVVPAEGVSAEDLYSRARAWMAKSYRSSNAVIQMDDKDNKKMIGKGVFDVRGYVGVKLSVRHTITFESREGRYKIRIDDLIVVAPDLYVGNQKIPGGEYELSDAKGRVVSNVEKEIETVVQSLKDSLQQPVKDDW